MSEVFGITGWKNSGKTTLVTKLIEEFSRRGFTVSTVKHAHHTFDLDQDGTDTHRHRTAGAHEVAIVSEKRWALMHEILTSGEEPSLNSILKKLAPCDLVLVEGYKDSDIPKIECIREVGMQEEPLWKSRESIIAVATNHQDEDCTKPQFDIDDTESIAHFMVQRLGLRL